VHNYEGDCHDRDQKEQVKHLLFLIQEFGKYDQTPASYRVGLSTTVEGIATTGKATGLAKSKRGIC
jgi:hypothetical protein